MYISCVCVCLLRCTHSAFHELIKFLHTQVVSHEQPVVVDNNQQSGGQQQQQQHPHHYQSLPSQPPAPPTRVSSQSVIDRIELKRAASNSDDKIAVNIDHLNESIYKINNFIRLSKDINELKRENSVRNDIQRKLSLKEQWLRNSGDNLNNSAQRINDLAHSIRSPAKAPISQSTIDLRRTSSDSGNAIDSQQFAGRIKSESIHNLQSMPSNVDEVTAGGELAFLNKLTLSDEDVEALSRTRDFAHIRPPQPKNKPSPAEAMRKIEAKSFSQTVDSIRDQLPSAPKVTTNTKTAAVDLSRFFPKKEAIPVAANVNKNQKDLKDVDLRKYFAPSPVQERSSLPSPSVTPKSGLSSPSLTPSSNLSPTVSRKNSLGSDTIPVASKPPIDLKQSLLRESVSNKLKSHPSRQGQTKHLESLYDQQLDGAIDLKVMQKRKGLMYCDTKSVSSSVDFDIDFDELIDDTPVSVERSPSKEYNNLFDSVAVEAGSSIEAIFDEFTADIVLATEHQNVKKKPKLCAEPKQRDLQDYFGPKIETVLPRKSTRDYFGPKSEPMQTDCDPKNLTYQKPAPKWCKKQMINETNVDDLYIAKLPTRLQHQIKLLEAQLASTEPLSILEDFTLTDTPVSTPETDTTKKVKTTKLKTAKNTITTATSNKKQPKKVSTVNGRSSKEEPKAKANGLKLTAKEKDKIVDENIALLRDELKFSSKNLVDSINQLEDIVEKKVPEKPIRRSKSNVGDEQKSAALAIDQPVLPPIKTLFKYKPLSGVLQRHSVTKSPMYAQIVQKPNSLFATPQRGTISDDSLAETFNVKRKMSQDGYEADSSKMPIRQSMNFGQLTRTMSQEEKVAHKNQLNLWDSKMKMIETELKASQENVGIMMQNISKTAELSQSNGKSRKMSSSSELKRSHDNIKTNNVDLYKMSQNDLKNSQENLQTATTTNGSPIRPRRKMSQDSSKSLKKSYENFEMSNGGGSFKVKRKMSQELHELKNSVDDIEISQKINNPRNHNRQYYQSHTDVSQCDIGNSGISLLERKISRQNLEKAQQEKHSSYGTHYAAKMALYRLEDENRVKHVSEREQTDEPEKLSHSQKLERFRREMQTTTETDATECVSGHRPLERKLAIDPTTYGHHPPLSRTLSNDADKYTTSYNTVGIQPDRPIRRKTDESTNQLIERSQKIHNRKQEFMNAKMASANPYMKQMMDDDDGIHGQLMAAKSGAGKSMYTSGNRVAAMRHTSNSPPLRKPSNATITSVSNSGSSFYRKPSSVVTTSASAPTTHSRNVMNLFRRTPMVAATTSVPSTSKKSSLSRSSGRDACNIS